MKLAYLSLITMVAAAAPAAAPDPWCVEPPPSIAFGKHGEIPAGDVFEVVASMRGNAEAELQKRPLIPLSDAQARKFTGAYYSCPKGKKPYLVRALCGFAGTGRFWIYRIKSEIWVLHQSLGTEAVSFRSALVLNLDFDHTRAYVSASVVQ